MSNGAISVRRRELRSVGRGSVEGGVDGMSLGLTPEDEDLKSDKLLEALGERRSRAILDATSRGAKSVDTLSEECDIPSSTIYRRVRELTEKGLLRDDVVYRENGQHVKKYRLSDQISSQEMDISPSLKVELKYEETGGGTDEGGL